MLPGSDPGPLGWRCQPPACSPVPSAGHRCPEVELGLCGAKGSSTLLQNGGVILCLQMIQVMVMAQRAGGDGCNMHKGVYRLLDWLTGQLVVRIY